MRIAVNGWFWGQMTTGSGQYLHRLARYLPEVAPCHGLSLLLPAAGVSGTAGPPSGWRVACLSTPFDSISENLAKLWFEQVAFPRACRRLGADRAFVPYWGSPWQRPCRIVVTVHDLIPLLLPAYRGGLLQRLYTGLVSRTARRADIILTDSQASRRDIVDHLGVPPQRVHAILLAADEDFRPLANASVMPGAFPHRTLPSLRQSSVQAVGLREPAEESADASVIPKPAEESQSALQAVRDKYHLPERFILYLGGFDVRKNVPRLVQAYGQFLRAAGSRPETPRLVIAGKLPAADTAFTPDPRRVVAEEGIGAWVHFTGWVDEADKPALYNLASLFVFPSLYEGFGLPAAEAAACGTPVVTSNRSSLPEAAPGATLVDPEDVAGIAAALEPFNTTIEPRPSEPPRTWLRVAQETWELIAKETD